MYEIMDFIFLKQHHKHDEAENFALSLNVCSFSLATAVVIFHLRSRINRILYIFGYCLPLILIVWDTVLMVWTWMEA